MLVLFLVFAQLDQYISPMQEKLKQEVLNTFVLVMRPIVRILFRYGIGYREFAEAVKTAFVDVASADFGLRGRPTNISRVAVMTGLTRKEVKRLRDKIASGDSKIEVKTTPLADVLHHWHAQPEFTDSAGKPLELPFTGEGATFSELVKKYGGDIPAGAMRTELKRVGAVTEDDSGVLTVAERSVKPTDHHENLKTQLVHGAYPVLVNITHNTNPDLQGAPWANRIAFTTALGNVDTSQLRRIAYDRADQFAESIDDTFMTYEALHKSDAVDTEDQRAISVGIFYFEEDDESADYEW